MLQAHFFLAFVCHYYICNEYPASSLWSASVPPFRLSPQASSHHPPVRFRATLFAKSVWISTPAHYDGKLLNQSWIIRSVSRLRRVITLEQCCLAAQNVSVALNAESNKWVRLLLFTCHFYWCCCSIICFHLLLFIWLYICICGKNSFELSANSSEPKPKTQNFLQH